MNKGLRWKVGLIVAVSLLCLYGMFGLPQSVDEAKANFNKNIKLGLDLKGGSHLVLQVQLQQALRAEAVAAADRFKAELQKKGIVYGNVLVSEPLTINDADKVTITFEGVEPNRAADFRSTFNDQFSDIWNLNSGANNSYTLALKPTAALDLKKQTVVRTVETIEKRINGLGLTESTVQQRGRSDAEAEILVQLPGVDDPGRIKALIQTAAMLEITAVVGGPFPSQEEALRNLAGPQSFAAKAVSFSREGQQQWYLVSRTPVVTGRDVRNARPERDQLSGKFQTQFNLSQDAARRFSAYTGANIGKELAVLLDNRAQTVATIRGQISDTGVIEGQNTEQESTDLATVLKAGSLPAGLQELEERVVGPSLGADSIRQGLVAGVVGLIAVVLAMLLYYKASGINATLALILNAVILIAILAYFGATLTLPGIAGIVLTIGMAVDSNVLIFERIREELRAGKAVPAAIDLGFSKAFLTIIDTHLTTVLSCACLFIFGTGAVKGFAVTLVIGLIANVFTAVFVSRVIFDWTHGDAKSAQKLSI